MSASAVRGSAPTAVEPNRIRPSAQHRGAPDVRPWANPTNWVFVAFAALTALSLTYLWGVVPLWAAIGAGTLGRYLGFTVLHESSHRTANRSRRVNDAMGWLPGLALTLTMPVFRSCHTKHHSYTNQVGIDPDDDVGRNPRWLRPLWLISPLWTYRGRYFAKRWDKAPRDRWIQIALDGLIVASIIAAVATGHAIELLVVAIVPLFLSLMLLTAAFDLIPHWPYDSTERFYDTRDLPSRTLNWLFLGQNYHLVHHLWNSVPWYR
ncbi:MAG: fatty acid desaturase, partial [Microthrixaceae bacterium]